jgi:hypothetical protein
MRSWSSEAAARASVREILKDTVSEGRQLRKMLDRLEREGPGRGLNDVLVVGTSTAALIEELDEVLRTYLRETR